MDKARYCIIEIVFIACRSRFEKNALSSHQFVMTARVLICQNEEGEGGRAWETVTMFGTLMRKFWKYTDQKKDLKASGVLPK